MAQKEQTIRYTFRTKGGRPIAQVIEKMTFDEEATDMQIAAYMIARQDELLEQHVIKDLDDKEEFDEDFKELIQDGTDN